MYFELNNSIKGGQLQFSLICIMSYEFHDDLGQWPITGQMKNNNTYSTPRISFFILNLTHRCNYFHSVNVKTCVV